jgi:hypothetical protein
MSRNTSIARNAVLSLAALLIYAADPHALWSAPPTHANNDKTTSSTDQSKTGHGKWSKSANTAPTISGTPVTTVLQDVRYDFQPLADDADGDPLSFSIMNRPRWAIFDSLSGRLFGKPGAGDIGVYSGIVISVSDGQASVELPPFDVEVQAYASGTATLSWLAPSKNLDGSALVDLSGYRLYWGPESGNYSDSVEISNPGITTFVVENLTTGWHYFAITAVNGQSLESPMSSEVAKSITP